MDKFLFNLVIFDICLFKFYVEILRLYKDISNKKLFLF